MKHLKVLVALLCILSTTSLHAQPKIGETVPEISLTDINGSSQQLSALRGKIVLVDFWASWCAPCRKSNRELAPIYSKYHGKGFEIFGVSLDKNVDDWKKAMTADKIKWIQTNEAGGWEAPIALKWVIEQLPSSFLISKEGKVMAINPSARQIEDHLKKQLP